MTIPWLGTKRIAFVPLFRTNAAPPDQIPPNWENLIRTRVLYNPRPEANGADRSLRAWLYNVSVRRADIDPLVLPMQTIDRQVVLPWDLDSRPWQGTTLGAWLRGQGFHAAQLVMLGGRGAGTSSGFWSRVVMAESNGVWLMELIHSLTRFADLYPFANDTDPPDRNIGYFDQMSASSQTHLTLFTKNEIGWAGQGCIARYHTSGNSYIMVYNSLDPIYTPPNCTSGVNAVRVGDGFPYVMVEARRKSNTFETGIPSTSDGQERGIPSEGVIAYRVQTQDPTSNVRPGGKIPLYLLTQTALQAGQEAVLDGGIKLKVVSWTPKGFIIRLFDPNVIVVEEPYVIVPWLTGTNTTDAQRELEEIGLVTDFSGPESDSEVINQMPDGNTAVKKGSTVHLQMQKITYLWNSNSKFTNQRIS